MGKPDVSIVIPVYNDEPTIERAVRSCLSQKGVSVEVIAVDDASTDGTLRVLESLAKDEACLRVIAHSENLQALEARRTGIEAASADHVLLLDGDDWLDDGVCAQALALARDRQADIVQFSIVPEYGEGVPVKDEVALRERLFSARDLVLEGDEIAHATYTREEVVWSLDGKLYERGLLLRALDEVPREWMFMSEDAYLFFVIAFFARRLVASSGLPCYRYSMGIGDTNADAVTLTAESFDVICKDRFAADRVEEFLDRQGAMDRFEEDFRSLRRRLLSDPTGRYLRNVLPAERPAAFDRLLRRWPAVDVIHELARWAWDRIDDLTEAVSGSRSLECTRRSVRTIAVYYRRMGTGGAELVTRDLMSLWVAMGYEVVFLCDEVGGVEYDLPAGVSREVLPDTDASLRLDYGARGEALAAALDRHDVDLVVYCQWLSPMLPWDLLITKTKGIPFVIHSQGTFTVLAGYGIPEITKLPPAFRLADGVVCLSKTDAAFWRHFNDRVFVTPNPMPTDILASPSVDPAGHVVLWVGRVEVDKWPREAILALSRVVDQVPDVRLLMVGPVNDDVRRGLVEDARSLGVEKNVEFLGNKSPQEMASIYRKASLFLLTSHYEGYCLALGEAMASGLPCVTYDMPYLTLLEGKRGVACAPVGDWENLGDKIAALLLDKPRRRQMGVDARTHMQELATFDFTKLWSDVINRAVVPHDPYRRQGGGEYERRMWNELLRSMFRHDLEEGVERGRLSDEAAAAREERDRLSCDLSAVVDSKSFKVGRGITGPGRKLRGLFGGK